MSHTWHSLLSLMQVTFLSNDCAVHSSTIRGSNKSYIEKGINTAAHLAAVANITPMVITDNVSVFIVI